LKDCPSIRLNLSHSAKKRDNDVKSGAYHAGSPTKVCDHFIDDVLFEPANTHKGARGAYFRPHLTALVQGLELELSHKPTAITFT